MRKQSPVRVSGLVGPRSRSEVTEPDSSSSLAQVPCSLLHTTLPAHTASFSLKLRPFLVTYHRRLCHYQSPSLPSTLKVTWGAPVSWTLTLFLKFIYLTLQTGP